MTTDEKTPIQASKSGGSEGLNGTAHPVINFDRSPGTRVSRTAAITALMYDKTNGAALAAAFDRVTSIVDRKVGAAPRAATYYYITYEVVLADDGGSGGPVRPPVDRTAAGLVLAGMSAGFGKREAA